MRGWYKDASYHPPPLARVTISTMTTERFELYQNIPYQVQTIPMGVQPFPVDDSIPEEKDIAWTVRRLFRNCLSGSSVMRGEHLCQWLIAATLDNTPDAKK